MPAYARKTQAATLPVTYSRAVAGWLSLSRSRPGEVTGVGGNGLRQLEASSRAHHSSEGDDGEHVRSGATARAPETAPAGTDRRLAGIRHGQVGVDGDEGFVVS